MLGSCRQRSTTAPRTTGHRFSKSWWKGVGLRSVAGRCRWTTYHEPGWLQCHCVPSTTRVEPFSFSTVEATVIDLVGYMGRAGGIDRVAGMLSELSDQIDPALLAKAAHSASVRWAQRAGYLLEFVGAGDKCAPLRNHVRDRARNYTRLVPSATANGAVPSRDWRLLVNTSIEVKA